MRLTLFDPVPWEYDADSPLNEGLGGSQSAACCLAVELVRLGHQVAFINATRTAHFCRGVYFAGRDRLFEPSDALIVLNGAIGARLRQGGAKGALVLWSQHDINQPAVAPLHDPEERRAWNRVVLVSRWQAERYASEFAIKGADIIGNALAPPFLDEPVGPGWFARGDPPVLTYTSTPFRGLEQLLDMFPTIRSAVPDVRLKVFSDMKLYRSSEDQWGHLYGRAADMAQVEFVGSVGQRRLARELAGGAAHAYPNTFPETFCNAAVEAAAMGAVPIVPQLGALPEVLGSAAVYPAVAAEFAEVVIAFLRWQRDNPDDADRLRRGAANRLRAECSPARRAQQWLAALARS